MKVFPPPPFFWYSFLSQGLHVLFPVKPKKLGKVGNATIFKILNTSDHMDPGPWAGNKVKQGHPMTAPTHCLEWASRLRGSWAGRESQAVCRPLRQGNRAGRPRKRQKRRSCPDSRLHSVSAGLPCSTWQWCLAYVREELPEHGERTTQKD